MIHLSSPLKTVKEKMGWEGWGVVFCRFVPKILELPTAWHHQIKLFLGPMVNRIFCRASPPSLDYGAAFFHIEQWRSRLDPAGKPLYSVKIRFTSHVHLHQKNLKKISLTIHQPPKKNCSCNQTITFTKKSLDVNCQVIKKSLQDTQKIGFL